MQLQFLGATKTVTGSKFLLRIGEKNILIDCGLFQGLKEWRLRNWEEFPIKPSAIDAIILTHAHLDHTGYLPVLHEQGFKGKIYCTAITQELCEFILPDSGFLQEDYANRANKHGYTKHQPAKPLYTKEQAIAVLANFVTLPFNENIYLFDDVCVNFSRAGHIIGAASVLIKGDNVSILFSGDLGRQEDLIMFPPASPQAADYIVMESTYGGRIHDFSDPQEELGKIINYTVEQKGTIIIPAFAVGRSQSILYYLYQLKSANKIPNIPVFLDSPMASNVTLIFKKHCGEYRISETLCKNICEQIQIVDSAADSKIIDKHRFSQIIVSASGMATGGRILHHLGHFIENQNNAVIFCGYQVPGTRGARLMEGEEVIKLFGHNLMVRAKIYSLLNMSAHADHQELIAWLGKANVKARKVFIVHGEEAAANALKSSIEQELQLNCVIPEYLQIEELNL